MRKVEIGSHRFTEVHAMDEPGSGGAHHSYEVRTTEERYRNVARIPFTDHPCQVPSDVNGVFNEDLLVIVLDRLYAFQDGPYASKENGLAITRIEEAMHWLKARADARAVRGVLGTDKV